MGRSDTRAPNQSGKRDTRANAVKNIRAVAIDLISVRSRENVRATILFSTIRDRPIIGFNEMKPEWSTVAVFDLTSIKVNTIYIVSLRPPNKYSIIVKG